jgi:hypothetical protein
VDHLSSLFSTVIEGFFFHVVNIIALKWIQDVIYISFIRCFVWLIAAGRVQWQIPQDTLLPVSVQEWDCLTKRCLHLTTPPLTKKITSVRLSSRVDVTVVKFQLPGKPI